MGHLMGKRCWRVVEPGKSPTDPLELHDWELTCEQASGLMYAALDDDMQQLVGHLLGRPKAMWDALAAHHMQKVATSRFVAYENLFDISKKPEESLTSLCMRISAAQAELSERAKRRAPGGGDRMGDGVVDMEGGGGDCMRSGGGKGDCERAGEGEEDLTGGCMRSGGGCMRSGSGKGGC